MDMTTEKTRAKAISEELGKMIKASSANGSEVMYAMCKVNGKGDDVNARLFELMSATTTMNLLMAIKDYVDHDDLKTAENLTRYWAHYLGNNDGKDEFSLIAVTGWRIADKLNDIIEKCFD